MTVKVLVQKSSTKILLAHCTEDFIDFLFSLVTVPLARVISVLSIDDGLASCVSNMHQCVSALSVGEYLKSQEARDLLLCPQLAFLYLGSNQLFLLKEERIRKFYQMPRDAEDTLIYLSLNSSPQYRELRLASPMSTEGGFLKQATKFMVTDDLVVTPFTSMSCIKYVQSFNVPLTDIEEQVIDIGMEEAINLLRATLISTSVLTNGLRHLIRIKPKTETSKEAKGRKPLKNRTRSVKKPKVEK